MKASRAIPTSVLLASMAVSSACQQPQLETRTIVLEHLSGLEAIELVSPYVYGERQSRDGGPGTISATTNALTVRETPENLDRIERTLVAMDEPRPDVRLRFQLVEADGWTERDARIARVEEELRRIFQFGGYRLAAETVVTAAEGSEVSQTLAVGDQRFELSARVRRRGRETVRLDDVSLRSFEGEHLRTTVNVRPGQTIVLGSSPRSDDRPTLLLAVTAERTGEGG